MEGQERVNTLTDLVNKIKDIRKELEGYISTDSYEKDTMINQFVLANGLVKLEKLENDFALLLEDK